MPHAQALDRPGDAHPTGHPGRFSRGHFEVLVLDKDLNGRGRTLKVDVPLAMQYVDALRTLQQALGLAGEVTLEMLTAQRDLIAVEETAESLDESWGELSPALARALDALTDMRRREGEALVTNLRAHLGEVETTLADIVERAPDLVQALRDRLRERVAELLDGRLPDPVRVEQEVALLAERSDVAEECDRLQSHIAQFRALLEQPGPQGAGWTSCSRRCTARPTPSGPSRPMPRWRTRWFISRRPSSGCGSVQNLE